MTRKGNSILVPKNCSNSAGVINMPKKFPMTELHRALAMFPLAAPVKKTHMLTVVGRQVIINIPSKTGSRRTPGRNLLNDVIVGKPIR
eukprot:CAMPEP_0172427024 /NCGR_PEP_ID=MMETSP1064-20121228/40227_1 /TAXON_ID=202472 /ORGANISM="Aulacoseira subarctica , Strain CCAP 1002/5" /LENGTH=87 /DNA_ID=CAMNT_0013170993 /DNA_START=1112 /DNA_END=1375 /DNA_ORIENTATION=+